MPVVTTDAHVPPKHLEQVFVPTMLCLKKRCDSEEETEGIEDWMVLSFYIWGYTETWLIHTSLVYIAISTRKLPFKIEQIKKLQICRFVSHDLFFFLKVR